MVCTKHSGLYMYTHTFIVITFFSLWLASVVAEQFPETIPAISFSEQLPTQVSVQAEAKTAHEQDVKSNTLFVYALQFNTLRSKSLDTQTKTGN